MLKNKALVLQFLVCIAVLFSTMAKADIRLIPRDDSGDPNDGIMQSAKDFAWTSWGNNLDVLVRGEAQSDGSSLTTIYSCPSIKACKSKECRTELMQPESWQCTKHFKGTDEELCSIYTNIEKIKPLAGFVFNQIFGGFLIGFVPYSTAIPFRIATTASTVGDARKTYQEIQSAVCHKSLSQQNKTLVSDNSTVQILRENEKGSLRTFLSVLKHRKDSDENYKKVEEQQIVQLTPLRSTNYLESKFVKQHLTPQECAYYGEMTSMYNIDGEAQAYKRNDLLSLLTVMKAECGVDYDPKAIPLKPQIWRIENAKFAILSDGQNVVFGNAAIERYEKDPQAYALNVITQNDLIRALSQPRKNDGLLAKIENRLKIIDEKGELIIALSGYTDHDSASYTEDKLNQLNSKAWGGGIGKEFVDERGNFERLMFTCFRDSHNDWECSVSYDYQEQLFRKGDFSVNAGFGAGLTSRSDILNRIPVTYVFPTASMKFGKVRYNVILIPKMGGVNNGAVLYFYATFTLK